MKLIGSTTSPYVRKVRVVMAEKKLDYQFVTENVWAADTRIGESNPLCGHHTNMGCLMWSDVCKIDRIVVWLHPELRVLGRVP